MQSEIDRQIDPFIRSYWGKARQAADAGAPIFHPLAYHCLDVAAVADAVLERSPRRLERLAAIAGMSPEALRRMFVALIALHDIGKMSLQFQAKSPEAWAATRPGEIAPQNSSVRHDAVGAGMLTDRLLSMEMATYFEDDGWRYDDGTALFRAVAGHHGKPVDPETEGAAIANARGQHADAVAFIRAVVGSLPPLGRMPERDTRSIATLSWSLAGLAVLADWIGSNSDAGWFPYAPPIKSLPEYWHGQDGARTRAQAAIQRAGILSTDAMDAVDPCDLLPHLRGNELSPLQKLAFDVSLPKGPFLALIEDVTGGGKTEAALLLAARLLAGKRADGLYFALPTMATANAMYDRIATSYRRLFKPDTSPSLVLAHGKRGLHDGFVKSVLEVAGRLDDAESRAGDEPASAACAAWIADDRRRAFLAHIGVGTVDQALMAVLPFKHQSLRLWGLTDRVLVIDEAHSFDAFVGEELQRLLQFHAALGGSAIVLSATLSTEQRQRLADAFAGGLGIAKRKLADEGYPLLSFVAADIRAAATIAAPAIRSEMARNVPVERIATRDEAVRAVVDLSARGASVAWIRNAVDDVIEAAEALRGVGLEPIVLHARMAMGDRLAIEQRLQEALGKESTLTTRSPDGKGLVIVGSQILESSLDYDVDGMITDLAPVDMIIQRVGRLWRHPRRTERPFDSHERKLLLLSPDPDLVENRDWYRESSARAAAVYPDHGIVWRSAKALLGSQGIRTPDGIRGLLASVYDSDEPIPPVLERAAMDAEAKRMATRSVAHAQLLAFDKAYHGNNLAWRDDQVASTRLGEVQTVFRLGHAVDGGIRPWCVADDSDVTRGWALSELSVRRVRAAGIPTPDRATAKLIEAAKQSWSKWEQDQPLLVLEPVGDERTWRGRVIAGKDGAEVEVLYDRSWGLRFR